MKEIFEKMKNKKTVAIASIVAILIIAVGVTYAFYTYSKNGVTSTLITGDMYMRYAEGSALNITDAMPSATYPSAASGNYFQFEITGRNTHTTKDISYDLNLEYGDSQASPKQRIADQYLLFKLVEVVDGEEVNVNPSVVDANYQTIQGATLATMTVPHNTTSVTTRTFRLYARISEEVGIGTGTTYTIQQWNNLYASIKINAVGGLVTAPSNTPTLIANATPASCFETTENQDGTLTITGYNAEDESCGTSVVIPNIIDTSVNPSQTSTKNKLNTTPSTLENTTNNNNIRKTDNESIKTVTVIGVNAFKCKDGQCGSMYEGTFDQSTGDSSAEDYSESTITSLTIPNTITTIGNSAFYGNTFSSIVIPNSVTTIGDLAFYGSGVESLTLGNHVTTIGMGAFAENSLTSITIPDSVTTIGQTAFEAGGGYSSSFTNLTIGRNVESIGDYAFYASISENLTLKMLDLSVIDFDYIYLENNCDLVIDGATTIPDDFLKSRGVDINSLTIGNSVTTIGYFAFEGCNIENLTLGSNVTTIGYSAFCVNNISHNLVLPSSVTTIGQYAFDRAFDDNYTLTIPDSVTTIGDLAFSFDYSQRYSVYFNKACSAITSIGDNYPWSAYKIYGSNNEICYEYEDE